MGIKEPTVGTSAKTARLAERKKVLLKFLNISYLMVILVPLAFCLDSSRFRQELPRRKSPIRNISKVKNVCPSCFLLTGRTL